MAKIKTKIPQLDELLGGGIDEGTFSVLWIKPGLDGIPFACQIANSAAKTNDVIYVINSKNPEAVKGEMKSYGFKTNRINFVDAYSGLISKKPISELSIADPKNIKLFVDGIAKISKKFKNPLIILDSLSTTIEATECESGEIVDMLKKIKATQLVLFTAWGGGVAW